MTRRRFLWVATVFLTLSLARPAFAEQRFIVRTTLGLSGLQNLCLLHTCSVVRGLDGTVNQLFLVTTSNLINTNLFLGIIRSLPGIVAAEVDHLLTTGAGLATLTTAPAALTETSPVTYAGAQVWSGYVNQPAAFIVRVSDAQNGFGVTGAGIVADIDTGVDPNHPVLNSVLLAGYDFTRNQSGASEMNDLPAGTPIPEDPCETCTPGRVNQASIAMVDQASIAMVDGPQYVAFGHGTMVAGVIHLVAPTSLILPLKAFHADGTGYLSDILRAFYYAVQNQANVINMSFDFDSPSPELSGAIDYATQNNVICVASVGNDGQNSTTYPASISPVLGVASTSDLDTRSTFSNYGSEVWVAAPGEQIVTTYPFGTYAAASGTSFSAPFVSGGAALLLNLNPEISVSGAAQATGHAKQLSSDMGNGRLDLFLSLDAANP